MPRLPDLVRDSQLEASFLPDRPDATVHTYHERALRQRRRLTRTEHWTRLRRIGHGGFASVYLEECTKPRAADKPRFRAVKKINIDQWSAHIDYTRELEAISKFSQPKYEHSFVKSYGWFKTSHHLFIAMEYLELGDLHNYLYHQKQRPLPEHEAQDVIYQVLYGLQEMHENEFIHRDLKLNNILIQACPPQNPWSVKIADFGISKRIEEVRVLTTAVKGTPGYMAPELHGFLKSENPYAADIWAAGEITFQALTKKSGFGLAGSISEYVRDVDKFPLEPLQDSRASNITIEFILALMRPIPGDRLTATQALSHDWFTQTLPALSTRPATTGMQPKTTSESGTLNEEFAPWDTVTLAKTSSTVLSHRPKQSVETEPSSPYGILLATPSRGRHTRSSNERPSLSLLDVLDSSPTLTPLDSDLNTTSKSELPAEREESIHLDGYPVRLRRQSSDGSYCAQRGSSRGSSDGQPSSPSPPPPPKPDRYKLSRRWLDSLDQARRQHEEKARFRARQARRAAEKDPLTMKRKRFIASESESERGRSRQIDPSRHTHRSRKISPVHVLKRGPPLRGQVASGKVLLKTSGA